jgi:hypothetical protein
MAPRLPSCGILSKRSNYIIGVKEAILVILRSDNNSYLVYNYQYLTVTDLATRGRNLLMGHREPTKPKGHALAPKVTCTETGTQGTPRTTG